jgi:hypothetical protein
MSELTGQKSEKKPDIHMRMYTVRATTCNPFEREKTYSVSQTIKSVSPCRLLSRVLSCLSYKN